MTTGWQAEAEARRERRATQDGRQNMAKVVAARLVPRRFVVMIRC